MKKSLLFTLLFAAIAQISMAQTVSTLKLTPMNQSIAANKDSFEVVLRSTLKNTSSKPKTIVWTRIYQSITTGWTTSICDKNACYAARIGTQTLVLAAGEESNIDVHLYPSSIAGAAIVNVVIADQDSAAVTITGRYGFNLAVGTNDYKNAYPDIQVYPNRTPQYFTIKDTENRVFEAVIFDVFGREIRSFKNPINQELNVENLSAGSYFVSLFNQKNELLKVVPLAKF
jgi:hypothetical protein